jgi:protein SCO1/2
MRTRTIAALIVAATVIGVATAWWVTARQPVVLASGTALESPRRIGAFRLTDHRGREFTPESLRGGWSLVFAGFTQCPDACPTTLAMLNAMDERLRANGGAVQVVFLSVDPARDTAERLAGYVGHFNPRFVAVTGVRTEIDCHAATSVSLMCRTPAPAITRGSLGGARAHRSARTGRRLLQATVRHRRARGRPREH